MPTEEKTTYSIDEKNLLNIGPGTLSDEDYSAVKAAVDLKPVKVELELLLPAEAGKVKVTAGVLDTLQFYRDLLKKAAVKSLAEVAKSYRDDQSGKAGCYEAADRTLSGLNKYVEEVMKDFRVDLRKNVAKKLNISAKELMTVGKISTKESRLKRGVFNSESAAEKRDSTNDDADIDAAFKSKKWHHVGLAASMELAKIVVDRKKPFKKEDIKKTMPAMFPEKERASLKFSIGMVKGESGTNVDFEFLEKTKVAKDPKTYGLKLRKGLKEQLNKDIKLDIKPVKTYTRDSKPKKPTTETTSQAGDTKKSSTPPNTTTTTTST